MEASRVLGRRTLARLVAQSAREGAPASMTGEPITTVAASTRAKASLLGLVHRLDLLHGHGAASHVHGAATAVLIVLALPDQLSPHPGEEMRVVGAIADGLTVDPLTFISAAILLVLMFLGSARIMDLIFPGVIFETSFLFPMLLHE